MLAHHKYRLNLSYYKKVNERQTQYLQKILCFTYKIKKRINYKK